jgi:hypothetical protein
MCTPAARTDAGSRTDEQRYAARQGTAAPASDGVDSVTRRSMSRTVTMKSRRALCIDDDGRDR